MGQDFARAPTTRLPASRSSLGITQDGGDAQGIPLPPARHPNPAVGLSISDPGLGERGVKEHKGLLVALTPRLGITK